MSWAQPASKVDYKVCFGFCKTHPSSNALSEMTRQGPWIQYKRTLS